LIAITYLMFWTVLFKSGIFNPFGFEGAG
jgi:hypothetical protein